MTDMLPMDPPSIAAEMAGNSTLLRLLLCHLQQKGLIQPAPLVAMIEQAERNTWQGTPLLAGSAVVNRTKAWLQTQGQSASGQLASEDWTDVGATRRLM